MQVDTNGDVIEVSSAHDLVLALRTRDHRSGANFWISDTRASFPCLAIRVSGSCADVHYFPRHGHPGYRALAHHAPSHDAVFVFDGCDPAAGEQVPADFVLELPEMEAIALHFLDTSLMSATCSWFEL